VAAEWRDTTFYLRGEFAHYALALAGEFSAITLQLSDEVEAEALKKGGGAKRFLTERMAYHLEAGLGRQVQFWFRLETADVARLVNSRRPGRRCERPAANGMRVERAIRPIRRPSPTTVTSATPSSPIPAKGIGCSESLGSPRGGMPRSWLPRDSNNSRGLSTKLSGGLSG